MQLCANKLDKKDFFGKSDPFLVFYRSNEDGTYARDTPFRGPGIQLSRHFGGLMLPGHVAALKVPLGPCSSQRATCFLGICFHKSQ